MDRLMILPTNLVETLENEELILVNGGGIPLQSTNNDSGKCSGTNNADGLCSGSTNNGTGKCSASLM